MKNIPVAVKVITNIIFFVIYSFIGIFFGNFLYGLTLTILNKPIAGVGDSVHLKIALISILVVLLLTGLFRKYFYFSIFIKKEIKTKQTKKSYTQKKKQQKEEKNTKEDESDEKMKIYIDKEIK